MEKSDKVIKLKFTNGINFYLLIIQYITIIIRIIPTYVVA